VNKLGKTSLMIAGFILVSAFAIFLFSGVPSVLASHYINTTDDTTNITANEDVYYFYNLSINNTDTNAFANITAVNITFDSDIFTHGIGGNGTDVAIGYTNSSNSTTFSYNSTNGSTALIPSGTTAWFWINLSADRPGIYNITIHTTNASETIQNNFTVIINDTTAPNTTMIAPIVNFGNYSAVNVTLNATVVDEYLNISTVWFNITNSSTGEQLIFIQASNASGSNTGTWNATLDAINVTGGLNLNANHTFNISIWANDTAGNINNTGDYFYNITLGNDTIAPTVTIITPSVDFTNKSGNVTLNVTVIDSYYGGASWVFFNITNSSGEQNATFTTRQIGSSNSWNVTIDTHSFPDGFYNISVWANDTSGNINNTVKKSNFTIDNTNASLTHSCSPLSVAVGGEVNCTCTATDATSGVNDTVYTAQPSTSNAGTSTTLCFATDAAGNYIVSRISYSVGSTGGGGGGSGGGSGTTTTGTVWATTFDDSSESLDTATQPVIRALAGRQRTKVSVNQEYHYVGVVSLDADSALIEVSSDPQQKDIAIGETAKFDITADGFYDLAVTVNSIENNKADLSIVAIHEEMSPEVDEGVVDKVTDVIEEKVKSKAALWIIIAVVIIIGVGVGIVMARKRKGNIKKK